MKNMLKYLLLGLMACGATLLAACDEQEFTREGGTLPDSEALVAMGADLVRPNKVDSRILLTYDDVTDLLRVRLSRPAAAATPLTLAVDESLLAEYNRRKGTQLPMFPQEKVTLPEPKDVPAGEVLSEDLKVLLQREGVEKGRYLLPLSLSIGEEQAPVASFCYEVWVFEEYAPAQIDPWPFKVVVYVDTRIVNPLIVNEYFAGRMDIMTGDMDELTLGDMAVLGKANVDLSGERAFLNLNPDLQYVLNHRSHYIQPIQKMGRKVLIAINNGPQLGLCNMTDEQIADVVYAIGKVVEEYGLDGVNFYDREADYTAMAPVRPASYAKLLRATHEALPDKLITLACDEQSTDLLAVPQQGVEAGRYVDYAWSGIPDEVVDAYAEGAKLKPIVGLDRSRYGAVMLQSNGTAWGSVHGNKRAEEVTNLYWNNRASANVFACWDVPLSRSGLERGGGEALSTICNAITDFENSFIMYFYTPGPKLDRGYGMMAKDW